MHPVDHARMMIDGASDDWLLTVAQFLDFPEFGRFLSSCSRFLQIADTLPVWKGWRELYFLERIPPHVHWVPREDAPLGHITSELRRAYCTFHFLKGIHAYENKEFDRAEDLFRTVLIVAPQHDQIMCRLADTLYGKAVSMDGEERPLDLDGYKHKGEEKEKRGSLLDDAKKLYEQALVLNPNNSYAMNGLALLVDEPSESRRLLEKAVQLDDVNSYALANLGGELMGIDDRRSLSYLDRALDINPQLFYARLHRSKVLLDLGDVDGAIDSVREQLHWRPEDGRARNFLTQLERHRDVLERLREAGMLLLP